MLLHWLRTWSEKRFIEERKCESIRYTTSPAHCHQTWLSHTCWKWVWNKEKRNGSKERSAGTEADTTSMSLWEHIPHPEPEWWGGQAPIETVGAHPKCCCPHRTWRFERRLLRCETTLPGSSPLILSKTRRFPPRANSPNFSMMPIQLPPPQSCREICFL